jgi:glycosyltransferase involved in cell wall biosynthesis
VKSRVRIAYFVTLFPKLSEAFVLNEVVGLLRAGVDIVPVSFESSERREPKAHEAARELPPAHYTRDAFPRGHLRALLSLLLRHPHRLLALFRANRRHPAPRHESKLGRFANAVYAAWLVEEVGIDHIHAHWSYPCDIAVLLSRVFSIPFSFTAHAHDIFEDIALYEEEGFQFADRVTAAQFVVCCTRYNRDQITALVRDRDKSKIHHAYHGIDVDRFRPPEHPQSYDTATIVSVGRFVPYKGFDVLVRACARLHSDARRFRCVIAGSPGSTTDPVRKQVAEAGLADFVELRGHQTQEELVALYSEADVYVNASDPSGEFGVANVIVEAMATGLPTIATRRPQVEEFVTDGVNALLVPYGDDAALAAAIARVLDDPDLQARLSKEGRATVVSSFRVEQAVETLRRLLMGCPGADESLALNVAASWTGISERR